MFARVSLLAFLLLFLATWGAVLAATVDLNSVFDTRFDGEPSSQAGYSIASGDFNGDGIGDLVVGAPYASHNGVRSGSVFVVYGQAFSAGGSASLSDPSTYAVRFDGPGHYAELGGAVAIGDLNSDGRPDLVLAAPKDSSSQPFAGSVFVVFGGAALPKTLVLSSGSSYAASVVGAAPNDYSGFSVATGDVDGDGNSDMVLGAPQASPNSQGASGSVFVITGSSLQAGSTLLLSNSSAFYGRFDGAQAGDRLGLAVIAADVLASGIKQVVASAPRADANGRSDSGSVYVIDVASNPGGSQQVESAYSRKIEGASSFDELGYSLASLDADGDGASDLAVGAPRADYGGVDSGSVFVVAGLKTAANVIDLSAGSYAEFDGAFANGFLGYSLFAGDLDSDGRSDLFLGAYGTGFNNRVFSGSAYFLNSPIGAGRASLTSSFSVRFDGAAGGDGAGFSVSGGAFAPGGASQAVIGAYTTSGGSIYLNSLQQASPSGSPFPSPTPSGGYATPTPLAPTPSASPDAGATPSPSVSSGPNGPAGGDGAPNGGDGNSNAAGTSASGSESIAANLIAELESIKKLPGFDAKEFSDDVKAIEAAIAAGDFGTARRLMDRLRDKLASRQQQSTGSLLPWFAVAALIAGALAYRKFRIQASARDMAQR